MTTLGRYLPSWIPGIQFPPYVARGQHLFGSIRNLGFDLVRKNIVSRQSSPYIHEPTNLPLILIG
jgi:hypothetical protein